MGLGLLLPSQAFIPGSQELDAEQGPFPWGLSPRAVGHEGRPQLPEVGQGRARAGQLLHLDPDPGAKQTLMGGAGGEVVGLRERKEEREVRRKVERSGEEQGRESGKLGEGEGWERAVRRRKSWRGRREGRDAKRG